MQVIQLVPAGTCLYSTSYWMSAPYTIYPTQCKTYMHAHPLMWVVEYRTINELHVSPFKNRPRDVMQSYLLCRAHFGSSSYSSPTNWMLCRFSKESFQGKNVMWQSFQQSWFTSGPGCTMTRWIIWPTAALVSLHLSRTRQGHPVLIQIYIWEVF